MSNGVCGATLTLRIALSLLHNEHDFFQGLKMSSRFARTIYVGNLPADIRESEVEDLFYKYGRILDIELKIPPRPPCYCFVEFESARDAEDAIRGKDGYNFDGCRLRVELAHGGRGPPPSSDRRGGYGGRDSGGRDRDSSGGGRFGTSRHSEYRVIVRGLPSSASWQDLKDHMRKAGDVCFAEVSRDRDGTFGIVDYTNYEDMKYAIRKLDDTEFKNPWTRSYIRVREYKRSPSRSPSRSRSRSRTPRRNRSKSMDRSISRSPSKSPVKLTRPRSTSRSGSMSRSASPHQQGLGLVGCGPVLSRGLDFFTVGTDGFPPSHLDPSTCMGVAHQYIMPAIGSYNITNLRISGFQVLFI